MLIGARGPPGFWSALGLFGRFWSVSGPRGSVCRDIETVNTASTRRIYPRSPEASTIFIFYLRIRFCSPIFEKPWPRPMGQGSWARVHGPGSMDPGPHGPGSMDHGPHGPGSMDHGPLGQGPWAQDWEAAFGRCCTCFGGKY